jgi:HSP20 family protein
MLNAFLDDPLGVAREMDRLLDAVVSSPALGVLPAMRVQAFPPVNLFEQEERLCVEAELPGMAMSDVEVLVTDDELTIQGKRDGRPPEGAQPLRRERPAGTFRRRIALPVPIDPEHVEARLVNGLLTIALPKAAESKPRKVAVKAAAQAT